MYTRRQFLKSSAALTTASVLLPGLMVRNAHAATPIPGVPFTVTDASGAVLLNPAAQPKFFNAVPNAASTLFSYRPADPLAPTVYNIGVAEIPAHVTGLIDINGTPLPTPVWGYQSYDAAGNVLDAATYPGRTIFSLADPTGAATTTVTWINDLRFTDAASGLTMPVPHLLPVDTTLNLAQPGPGGYDAYGVPIVVHQHGGPTPHLDDGGPDQWFTPTLTSVADSPAVGPGCVDPVTCNLPSVYPGTTEGGMVWYHDHALGITRLNVYAGTAGFWLTRDANELALFSTNTIPQNYVGTDNYEVALAFQDRQFLATGELYFPSDPALYPLPGLTLPTPTHMPEFYGEIMLVNGVAWPKLDVEPRPIRLRLLNGSDSRFYNLRLISNAALQGLLALTKVADRLRVRFPNLAAQLDAQIARSLANAAQPMWQIGTELGLLDHPVQLTSVNIAPGERVDVVVDFGKLKNRQLVFVNDAAIPYPFGAPTPLTSGAAQLMQINVNRPLNAAVPVPPPLTTATVLRPVSGPLGVPTVPANAIVRQLILAEGADHFGRIMPLMGTVADGTILYDEAITERPVAGTTEVWEFYNISVDSHPLHMHLVDFRVLDREAFTSNPLTLKTHTTAMGTVDGIGPVTGIALSGAPVPALISEQGRKDTVQCPPGEVTRVLVTFPANSVGKYVYHCHILSHEDSEMMRFYEVLPA